jgi:hypothetical protein
MNPGLLIMVFGSFAAVLWLVSAVFWARRASIEIRDNQDAFIGDLQRAGYWNTWAARSACAAAVFSCIENVRHARINVRLVEAEPVAA